MVNIDNEFLRVYEPQELIEVEHTTPDLIPGKYGNLKSRHQIHVSQSEMDELASDENFWFYKSDAELYRQLDSLGDLSVGEDFSNSKNLYGLSEYVGSYEKYLPYMAYLQYSKMNNLDVIMNVYDANSLYDTSRRPRIISDKAKSDPLWIHNVNSNQEFPEFEFNIPKKVKYTKFIKSKYVKDLFIPIFQDPIHILSVNIPLEYYRHQPLPVSIYNWDIDNEEHRFANLYSSEFESMLEDICNNGIRTPLFMRMNGEILSSTNTETNVILFIAKLLNLPTIPVNIYLSNEDIGKNHMIDATSHRKKSMFKSLGFMNHILKPYILLHKPDQPMEIDNQYQSSNYPVFSSDEYLTVRYLDTDVESPEIGDKFVEISNEEHKRLKEDLDNEINRNIETVIQELLRAAEEGSK